MRNRILLVLAASLSLPATGAWAAGPSSHTGATPLSASAVPREVRLTVPVEISNYPSRVAHPGAGPIEVTCALYVPSGPGSTSWVGVPPVASAPVPFDPKAGLNSYQGSVTVSLSLPPGSTAGSYICQIIDPATDGMPLNSSASATEINGQFTP